MKIKITNISEGLSDFDFTSNCKELDIEDESTFLNSINVHVKVQKFDSNYLFEIDTRTIGHFQCDCCLEEFENEIKASRKIAFTPNQMLIDETSDDVYLIPPSEVYINLSPYIREMLLLALPQKNLCSEDCKGLCPTCGANLNYETCQCKQKIYDSRWDALKKLIKV